MSKFEGYYMVKVECQGGGEIAIDGASAVKLLKWVLSRTGVDLSEAKGHFVMHVAQVKSQKQFDLFYNLGEMNGITEKVEPISPDPEPTEPAKDDKKTKGKK